MSYQHDILTNQSTRKSCQRTANTFPHHSQQALKNDVGLPTRWSSVLTLCLLWFTVMPVAAATLVVNSNVDTTGTAGICTLRDAITAANTNAAVAGCTTGSGTDSITFAPSLSGQTITLTSLLPPLASDLTIDGTSLASHVQISGDNKYQGFYISSGITVILTHLDIVNGLSTSGNYNYDMGGGIENHGTLTVNNSTLSGNSADYGGGIYSDGPLTVNNSIFSNNSADEDGGGIWSGGSLTVSNSTLSGNSASEGGGIRSDGPLTISNSTLSGNSAIYWGGGIMNWDTLTISNSTLSGNSADNGGGIGSWGTLTISNSTLSGNSTNHYAGGGIANNGGMLTVNNSTLSGNSASENGGGIYNSGDLTVSNSTLSGNSASENGGGIYNSGGLVVTVDNSTLSGNSASENGGGIYNSGSSGWGMTVNNSTLSGNSATYDGGGIYSSIWLDVNNSTLSGNSATYGGGGIYSSSWFIVNNSILANNGVDCYVSNEYGDSYFTGDHNLMVNPGNCDTSSLIADPMLGPLADNGGSTQTFALLAGSSAIDAGDDATCLTTDQRGYARVGTCDIGAFEYMPMYVFSTAKDPASTGTGNIATTTTASGNYAAGTAITLATTGLGAGETVTWSSATCTALFTMPASALTCTALFTAVPPPTTYAFNTVKDPASTGTGSIATTTTASGNYAAGTTLTLATTGLGAGETVTWSPATCVAPTFSMPADALICKALFTAAPSTPVTPITPAVTPTTSAVPTTTPVTSSTPPLQNQVLLQVHLDGTGQGKVTTDTGISCQSSDCQVNNHGDLECNPQFCNQAVQMSSTVILTPQPDAGSVFSSWGGDEDCVDGQVFIDGGHWCIAFFDRIYPLSLTLQGQGQVVSNEDEHLPHHVLDCGTQCSAWFSTSTDVELQANPSAGWWFSEWSGDCQGSQNPLRVEVLKEMTCQAIFVPMPTKSEELDESRLAPSTEVTSTVPVVAPSMETAPVVTTTVETPATVTVAPTGDLPAEASNPVVPTETASPVVPAETASTVVPTETSSPVVPTEASSPVVPAEASSPVVPAVITPTPTVVAVIPIQPLTLVSTTCPTSGDIDQMCNYGGQTVTTLNVLSQGIMVSNGILDGTLTNAGWVSNFTLTATGKLSGGVVTGYMVNEGIMLDFEFKGMSIIGGALGGVIRNTSKVGGYFQNVTLLAGTKITGGSLKGTIKGDKKSPALLENVRVKKGSKLSGVKLGKGVILEKGVVVE